MSILIGVMTKKNNTPPYIINKKILKRFNQRQTVFGRKLYDNKSVFYKKGMYDNTPKIVTSGKKGYSHLDFAKMMGSWTVYDYFHNAFSCDKLRDANSVMEKPVLDKFVVKDSKKMSEEIKKGDMVKHVFKKYKYKVLEIKEEPELMDEIKLAVSSNHHFKNVKCLCENGEIGWLSSDEIEKIKR